MNQKKAYKTIMNAVRESIQPFFNELETGLRQKLAELEQSCGQIIDVQGRKIAGLQCIVEEQGEKIEWLLSCKREVPVETNGEACGN